MADYTSSTTVVFDVEPDLYFVELDVGTTSIAGQAQTGPFFQRIYDTGVGDWVYYSGDINLSPLSTETVPNHTNNLVTSTHESY